jgi:hypothetical protein
MTDDVLVVALREVVRRGVADDVRTVRGLLADLLRDSRAVGRVAVAGAQEEIVREVRLPIAMGATTLTRPVRRASRPLEPDP